MAGNAAEAHHNAGVLDRIIGVKEPGAYGTHVLPLAEA